MQARFGDRAFVAKSLPIFLEFAAPDVSKSAALAFLGKRLGFTAAQCVAFGDGENDRDLLAWAGPRGLRRERQRAPQGARPTGSSRPSATDGVAQFLEQVVAARTARKAV